MALTRLAGWPALLDQFIQSRLRTPFRFGVNDCGLFTADAIKAITGTDIGAEFRDKWTDEATAATVLAQYGGTPAGVADVVAKQFEMPEIKPLLAQRGDWVSLDGGEGVSLGIVGLDGCIYGVGARGLKRVPITHALKAWRV